jgi:hypothetical protein
MVVQQLNNQQVLNTPKQRRQQETIFVLEFLATWIVSFIQLWIDKTHQSIFSTCLCKIYFKWQIVISAITRYINPDEMDVCFFCSSLYFQCFPLIIIDWQCNFSFSSLLKPISDHWNNFASLDQADVQIGIKQLFLRLFWIIWVTQQLSG